MTQVGTAPTTRTLESAIPFSFEADRALRCAAPKGWPATAGIVLGIGIKQRISTVSTRKDTGLGLLIIPWRCPSRFCESELEHHEPKRIPSLAINIFRFLVVVVVVQGRPRHGQQG